MFIFAFPPSNYLMVKMPCNHGIHLPMYHHPHFLIFMTSNVICIIQTLAIQSCHLKAGIIFKAQIANLCLNQVSDSINLGYQSKQILCYVYWRVCVRLSISVEVWGKGKRLGNQKRYINVYWHVWVRLSICVEVGGKEKRLGKANGKR